MLPRHKAPLALIGLMTVILTVEVSAHPGAATQAQDLYKEGADALYNLDFARAESTFQSLAQQYPNNPDYLNGIASSIWLKILYDQQKLNMESFSGKNTFGTSDSKDGVDAKLELRLRNVIEKSIALSDTLLKKNHDDIQALYAKGVANATLASFEGTVKRSYRAANSKAKTARDLHKRVLVLDPDFHDAQMTIGIYNYVVGVIPWPVRAFIGMLGIASGDGKDTGILQLKTAAAQGKRASVDAKMLLVVVYNRENRYNESLHLINELHARYPRNFMFEMSKASIYGRLKDWNRAADVYKQILDKVLNRVNGYERMRVEKVYYELGNTQIHGANFEGAASTFVNVIRGEKASPNEKAVAHLWMGKMLDGRFSISRNSEERARALEHYSAVEKLDCDSDLRAEARKLKRRPFTPK